MKIRAIMSPTVDSLDANCSIDHAARRMADDDFGAFPILSEGKLVGILTDRDIAVRGVAEGVPPNSAVRTIMTKGPSTCGPGDDVESVLALMSREQIRRMPVVDQNQDVIGMVTLTDVAKIDFFKKQAGDTLSDICVPGGLHCQAAETAELLEASYLQRA